MSKIAIIGTAGRDGCTALTLRLWTAMLDDARARVHESDHLISGGAAWADHLAVALFLEGSVLDLTLHLPAPFMSDRFEGGRGSAGDISNFYHRQFHAATGINGRQQIRQALLNGAQATQEPAAQGFGAFFARNARVAASAASVIAYTWADDEPSEGGTKHTWDLFRGRKRAHVCLCDFV